VRLLLVQWSGDALTEPTGAPTITDNLGVPLTYSITDWKHRGDGAPTVFGQAASWTATVASSAAMTITVTSGAASGDRTAALKVTVLNGADTSSPVGAHGKSGSSSAASIAQSYTAQATGGWGFLTVTDFDQLGAETAGTGTTVIGSANVSTSITYGFHRRHDRRRHQRRQQHHQRHPAGHVDQPVLGLRRDQASRRRPSQRRRSADRRRQPSPPRPQ